MHQALAWLLKVYYVVGSLATIASYCSTSILQADLLYYLNNLMFTKASQYTDMEINSKNASAYIGMILSVSSVCLMLATVYQMTRFVKQINQNSLINEKPKVALNDFVVAYHVLMLVVSTCLYGVQLTFKNTLDVNFYDRV